MKTFYFVRHGESEANASRRIAGWQNSPLSLKGQEQVADTAKRLKKYPIEAIYSSDLKRAMETAEALATILDLEIQQSVALREINMGDWEGLKYEEIPLSEEMQKAWYSDNADFRYPAGEAVSQVVERSLAFFQTLLEKPEDHVVLVGHGLTFSALIAQLVFKDYKLSSGFQLHNGSISVVHVDEGYHYLSALNQ